MREMVGRSIRRVEELGVLHFVEVAAMVDGFTGPQRADDVDRFFEHASPRRRGRPAVAEDMLVEGLAGADTEEEPIVEEQRRGRGGLGDDRRVDADGRARHTDADAQSFGRGGDRAQHRPHERAVTLRAHPRVVVVRDGHELEARVLGSSRIAHEILRAVFLTRERVTERNHFCDLPVRAGAMRARQVRPR